MSDPRYPPSPPPPYRSFEGSGSGDATEYQESACSNEDHRDDITDSQSSSGSASSDEIELIIGVDFGTTYSSAAYAFSDEPHDIHVIGRWPGLEHDREGCTRCPTRIDYRGSSTFLWGFQVDKTSSSYFGDIKELLDSDLPKPRHYLAEEELRPSPLYRMRGKEPMDIAVDYIMAIYEHTIQTVESHYSSDYIEWLPKHLVLSVPVVWSDRTKDLILQTVKNAGVRSVQLIKDPEAAVLSTISDMEYGDLNVGDAVILCDAGGLITDVVSYKVTGLQPSRLAELTACTGGIAGSAQIDRGFEFRLKNIIGSTAYSKLLKNSAYPPAMWKFSSEYKTSFTSRNQRSERIVFEGVKFRKSRVQDCGLAIALDGRGIELNGKLMFDLFDPIVGDIKNLVYQHVKGVQRKDLNVKAIILCGGFGTNQYLFSELTTLCGPDMKVIQAKNPFSAVARGAVLSQMPSETQVVSHIAPKHYGFRESRLAGPDEKGYLVSGRYYVEIMEWSIKKGDLLDRAELTELEFCRRFRPNPSEEELQVTGILYECSLHDAPRYFDTDTVAESCILHCDLSGVPESQFEEVSERVNGSRECWWELHFQLVSAMRSSGLMVFGLRCGGKYYGEINVEYCH